MFLIDMGVIRFSIASCVSLPSFKRICPFYLCFYCCKAVPILFNVYGICIDIPTFIPDMSSTLFGGSEEIGQS